MEISLKKYLACVLRIVFEIKNLLFPLFSGSKVEIFGRFLLFFFTSFVMEVPSLSSTGCLNGFKPTTRFFTTKTQIEESKQCFLLLGRNMFHDFRLNLILVSSSCGLMFSIVYFQE